MTKLQAEATRFEMKAKLEESHTKVLMMCPQKQYQGHTHTCVLTHCHQAGHTRVDTF